MPKNLCEFSISRTLFSVFQHDLVGCCAASASAAAAVAWWWKWQWQRQWMGSFFTFIRTCSHVRVCDVCLACVRMFVYEYVLFCTSFIFLTATHVLLFSLSV